MFWKFNVLNTQIGTLLEKEDVTLQELLDEDDVLQECKAQNSRLVNFLVRPENIEELVNLVTQEPSDCTDEKAKYKFPNTACELLTSDVGEITDTLITSDGLLAKIYAFLEAEGPLNSLLASFFSKLMGLLIMRKSEMMIEFLRSKQDFVGQLLHHIGTSAIMDLLLRLITCIESPETRITCTTWLNEERLVQRLMDMIDASQSDEKHCNASQSLCDIIRLSREQMSQLQEKAETDPLLVTIESTETLSSLLSHMFDTEHHDSVLVNGLSVLQTLLEFRKVGPEGIVEDMTKLDTERHAQGVSNALDAITPRLKDFHEILLHPPKQTYSPMQTTFGSLDPPLGNARLQVARLLSSLLHTNRHCVNLKLAELGTLNVLMELLLKYSFNNFLHTQVEQCVCTVLANVPTQHEDKASEHPLLDQLFSEGKILDNILNAFEENEQQQSRPGGHRRGYMGHLTKITSELIKSMEKGNNVERIKELMQECPEDKRERWEVFVSGPFAELIKQSTCDLVSSESQDLSTDDDDPDFRNISFPNEMAMQKARRKARLAYTDYQVQQMTSNFINQFGFDDDEFTEQEDHVNTDYELRTIINFEIDTTEESQQQAAALFEQACNEKTQHLYDADSDEDLWEEKELTFSSEPPKSSLQSSMGTKETSEDSESSDASTDSEEELDSPGRIYQSQVVTPPAAAATTSTTAMDVDTPEPWTNFVAMETASPWQNDSGENSMDAPSGDSNDNWAHFDDSPSPPAPPNQDAWADFRVAASNSLNSTTSTVPRSNSPVAMETSESAIPRCSYSASAPADLGSEVSTAVTATVSNGDITIEDVTEPEDDSRTHDSIADEDPPGSPSSAEMAAVDSEVTRAEASSASPGGVDVHSSGTTTPDVQAPETTEMGSVVQEATVTSSEDVASLVQSATDDDVEVSSPLIDDDDDDSDDMDDEDELLEDNFNFLSSCGLMRSSAMMEKPAAVTTTTSDRTDLMTEDRLMEDRTAESTSEQSGGDSESTTKQPVVGVPAACSGDDSAGLVVTPSQPERAGGADREMSPLAACPALPAPEITLLGASYNTDSSSSSTLPASTGEVHSQETQETKSKQQQLEEIRAQAKAALELFTNATTHNGPV